MLRGGHAIECQPSSQLQHTHVYSIIYDELLQDAI